MSSYHELCSIDRDVKFVQIYYVKYKLRYVQFVLGKSRHNRPSRDDGPPGKKRKESHKAKYENSDDSQSSSGEKDSALKTSAQAVKAVPDKIPPPSGPQEISSQSRRRLEEILFAFAMTFETLPYVEKSNPVTKKPTPVEFLNFIEGPTRCMVKFAKNLSAFRNVPVLDQVILLKSGIVETIVLFSSRNFNQLSGGWELKEGNTKIVETEQTAGGNAKTEYKSCMGTAVQFMSNLLQRIGSDKTIIKLLGVLSLFSPDRSGLSEEGHCIVAELQEEYAVVLQEYLQMRYPDQRSFFAEMIMMLVRIRDVGENTGYLLANTDVRKLNPFIVDLFDLEVEKSSDEEDEDDDE